MTKREGKMKLSDECIKNFSALVGGLENQMTADKTDGEGTDRHWPDPTREQVKSPLFEAIWQTIKRWDINVPSAYAGYCGATGNHVRTILDAIEPYGEKCRAEYQERLDNLAHQVLEEREKAEKLVQVLESCHRHFEYCGV